MHTLKRLNDGNHRDMLSGEDEVAAFREKAYVKLHKSTMAKVYWFQSMYVALKANKVKVSNYNVAGKINNFIETTAVKVLSFVAVLFTIFQGGSYLYTEYVEPPQKEVTHTTDEPSPNKAFKSDS